MTATTERPAASARNQPGQDRPPLLDGWSVATVALAAVTPFVGFVDANAWRLVWLRPVVVAGGLWLVAVLGAFVGVRLLTRRRPPFPIAAAVAVANLALFNYWRWFPIKPSTAGEHWLSLAIWLVAAAVAARLAMLAAAWRPTRVFAVVFLGVWCASMLVSTVGVRGAVAAQAPLPAAPAPAATFTQRPNVYWFVLDEHARADQLRALTGVDSSGFDADLADRGFSVSGTSTAGYLQTHLSLTSTLTMDYPWQPGMEQRGEYSLAAPVMAGDNPVVDAFEANGYRYVGAPDGRIEWATCPEPGPGRDCIEPESGPVSMHEPLSFLVWSTPVGTFDLPNTHNDPTTLRPGIDRLLADDQPFLLYAHLLSPHFPARYDDQCGRGPWISELTLDEPTRTEVYAHELGCLDRAMTELIDHVLAQDPDAVIAVQSDHGSQIDFRFGVPLDRLTDAQLTERFAALNAIRLPGGCRGTSIEGQPLVNTFPLILACLSGTEPDLRPTRHFYSDFADVRSIVEVPDERVGGP